MDKQKESDFMIEFRKTLSEITEGRYLCSDKERIAAIATSDGNRRILGASKTN